MDRHGGSEQHTVGALDVQAQVVYTLSTTVEQNSRGITSSVKAHVDFGMPSHMTAEQGIEWTRLATQTLLAAGAMIVASRKKVIESAREDNEKELLDAIGEYDTLKRNLAALPPLG